MQVLNGFQAVNKLHRGWVKVVYKSALSLQVMLLQQSSWTFQHFKHSSQGPADLGVMYFLPQLQRDNNALHISMDKFIWLHPASRRNFHFSPNGNYRQVTSPRYLAVVIHSARSNLSFGSQGSVLPKKKKKEKKAALAWPGKVLQA